MRKHICIGLWLVCCAVVSAQDAVFSQFFAAPLHVNPAFAGITQAPRITLNARSQWAQFDGGYKTAGISYEQSIKNTNAGFGLSMLADDAMNGIFRTYRVSGVFGYELQADATTGISMGLEAGYIQSRWDWGRLRFGDQINPLLGFYNPSGGINPTSENAADFPTVSGLDISAGLLAFRGRWYAGTSIKHLNGPDQGVLQTPDGLSSPLPWRFSLHGGMEIFNSSRNKQIHGAFITPNVMYVRQGDFSQLSLGAFTGIRAFFVGMWYRHASRNPDALSAMLGIRQGPLKMGYSYDMTISGLAGNGLAGAHEISLSLTLDETAANKKKKASDINNCFQLFR